MNLQRAGMSRESGIYFSLNTGEHKIYMCYIIIMVTECILYDLYICKIVGSIYRKAEVCPGCASGCRASLINISKIRIMLKYIPIFKSCLQTYRNQCRIKLKANPRKTGTGVVHLYSSWITLLIRLIQVFKSLLSFKSVDPIRHFTFLR